MAQNLLNAEVLVNTGWDSSLFPLSTSLMRTIGNLQRSSTPIVGACMFAEARFECSGEQYLLLDWVQSALRRPEHHVLVPLSALEGKWALETFLRTGFLAAQTLRCFWSSYASDNGLDQRSDGDVLDILLFEVDRCRVTVLKYHQPVPAIPMAASAAPAASPNQPTDKKKPGPSANPPAKNPSSSGSNSQVFGKKKITFPPRLCKEFRTLWKQSLLPNNEVVENGGTLVQADTGDLLMVNSGKGTSGTFQPNLNVPNHQKIVGIFHTHPYDDGLTNVSLSGGDAAYMINSGQEMIIAKSGGGLFIYRRTSDTPSHVNYQEIDDAQNARIAELVGQGKKFPKASRIAAQETAKKLKLEYYQGRGCSAHRIK